MEATAAFSGGNALDAMNAAFVLQLAVGALRVDREHDAIDAAKSRVVVLDDLILPFPTLGVPRVHPEEFRCEEGCLLAPGGRPDLDDDRLVVLRVLGHQHALELQ